MAEPDEKKNEEQENNDDSKQIREKNIPIKLIFISFLIIALLFGGYFMLKSGILSGSGSDNTAIALENQDAKTDIGPIYPLETFIVNLVGNQGKSYLKAKIELELNDEKLKKEIDKRLPQFRDTILTLLSNKSDEEIKSLEGKYQLREEIVTNLNQFLTTGKVLNIYFTDFIVQ